MNPTCRVSAEGQWMTLRRRAWLGALLIFLISSSPIAFAQQGVSVRDLNPDHYTVAELAFLVPRVVELSDILSFRSLGSQQSLTTDEWTPEAFARYAAGVLESYGYNCLIATEGDRTWILADIALSGSPVWIPIKTLPANGEPSSELGTIPMSRDGRGWLVFDPSFVGAAATQSPDDNALPAARSRGPDSPGATSTLLRFRALAASDPDGEILLFHWDFGDGTYVAYRDNRVATHTYTKQGVYTITLRVIDNHGGCGVFAYELIVEDPDNDVCIPCGEAQAEKSAEG